MISIQKLSPEVYSQMSRDYQFIGHLYDIVLNSIKTNADLIKNLPVADNYDESLVQLLAYTLGFNTKQKYFADQLVAICKIFSTLLANKGTFNAITLLGNTLLHTLGSTDTFKFDITDNILNLYLPENLANCAIIKEVLKYILPAGISCNIIKTAPLTISNVEVTVNLTDKVTLNLLDQLNKDANALLPAAASIKPADFVNNKMIVQ